MKEYGGSGCDNWQGEIEMLEGKLPLLHLTAVRLDGRGSIPDRRSYSILVGQVQTGPRPTLSAVECLVRGKTART
jgi:hypothetical protein